MQKRWYVTGLMRPQSSSQAKVCLLLENLVKTCRRNIILKLTGVAYALACLCAPRLSSVGYEYVAPTKKCVRHPARLVLRTPLSAPGPVVGVYLQWAGVTACSHSSGAPEHAANPRTLPAKSCCCSSTMGWPEMKQAVTDSHQIRKQLEREFQCVLLQILDYFSPHPP